ncbi:MAG TPA: P-II family nitrogen regulator [bacterium]|nr:P-II family nitrogen regulator [bacterium]
MTTLREINAIIRTSRWKATLEALRQAGFSAVTRQRVYGRGRQRGLRYAPAEDGSPAGAGIPVLPKWLLTLVLEDHDVDAAVAAIIAANRTGSIGDGKIFISRIDQTLRLSTLETNAQALTR